MKSYDSNDGLQTTKQSKSETTSNDLTPMDNDKKSGRTYDISGHIKKDKSNDTAVSDESPVATEIDITPLSVGANARPTPKKPKSYNEPTASEDEVSTKKMLIKFGAVVFSLVIVFGCAMFGKDYVSDKMSDDNKRKEFDFAADAEERTQYIDCLTPIDSSVEYTVGVGDSLKFPCHARNDMYVEFQFSDYTNSTYLCDAVAANGDSVSFTPSEYLQPNRFHELSIRQAVYKSDSTTPVLISDVVIKIKVEDDSEQRAVVEAANQQQAEELANEIVDETNDVVETEEEVETEIETEPSGEVEEELMDESENNDTNTIDENSNDE